MIQSDKIVLDSRVTLACDERCSTIYFPLTSVLVVVITLIGTLNKSMNSFTIVISLLMSADDGSCRMFYVSTCAAWRRARRTLTRSIAFKYSEENKVTDNYSMSERLRLAHGSSERERGGQNLRLVHVHRCTYPRQRSTTYRTAVKGCMFTSEIPLRH